MTPRKIVLSGYRLTRESFDTDAAWARAVEIYEASTDRQAREMSTTRGRIWTSDPFEPPDEDLRETITTRSGK